MDRLPSTRLPASIGLTMDQPTYVAQAHNRRRQTVSQGVSVFRLRATWPPLTRAEIGPLIGFLAMQDGRANVFEIVQHTRQQPLGLGAAATEEATENLVKWSERLDFSPWAYSNPADTLLSGFTTAPDGQQSAYLWNISAAASESWCSIEQLIGSLQGSVTVSVYLKAGSASRTGIALRNETTGGYRTLTVAWSGAVPSIDSSAGSIEDSGIISIGDSWYRLWFSADLAASFENGDQFKFIVYPRVNQLGELAGTYIWGAGVTPATLTPLEYLRTWAITRSRGAGPRVSARRNLVPYSDDFSVAEWEKTGAVDPATGPEFKGYTTDPFGGLYAQSWGTPADNGPYSGRLEWPNLLLATPTQYVMSAYVKMRDATRAGIELLRGSVYSHSIIVEFDSGGVPSVISTTSVDGYGIDSAGNGWYRVWLVLDAATRGLNSQALSLILYPHLENDGDPLQPEGTFFWRVQVEPDRVVPGYPLGRAGSEDPEVAEPGGMTIYTEGWDPNLAGVLKANDIIKFDGHSKVYLVCEDADSDGYGNAQLVIRPTTVEQISAGESIIVENVPFTVQRASDELPQDGDGNDWVVLTHEFLEAL